mmetsp:Transcript_2878/g.8582  ORF Transcript_2878/g.8582 Transcript_2878/m.8582 type:complete len:219 (+) Transcript_2878:2515-3171(+)
MGLKSFSRQTDRLRKERLPWAPAVRPMGLVQPMDLHRHRHRLAPPERVFRAFSLEHILLGQRWSRFPGVKHEPRAVGRAHEDQAAPADARRHRVVQPLAETRRDGGVHSVASRAQHTDAMFPTSLVIRGDRGTSHRERPRSASPVERHVKVREAALRRRHVHPTVSRRARGPTSEEGGQQGERDERDERPRDENSASPETGVDQRVRKGRPAALELQR